jgi:CBS-domain-containing membrane protein
MTIGSVCTHDVLTCGRLDSLASAARTMMAHQIGALVVVDFVNERVRPIGIVTDRDIVIGQLNHARDLFCLNVEDIMTSNPFAIAANSGIAEAVARLSERAVCRAPVVDEKGNLFGIVSTDDLLPLLADQLDTLAYLIGTQSKREHRLAAPR